MEGQVHHILPLAKILMMDLNYKIVSDCPTSELTRNGGPCGGSPESVYADKFWGGVEMRMIVRGFPGLTITFNPICTTGLLTSVNPQE